MQNRPHRGGRIPRIPNQNNNQNNGLFQFQPLNNMPNQNNGPLQVQSLNNQNNQPSQPLNNISNPKKNIDQLTFGDFITACLEVLGENTKTHSKFTQNNISIQLSKKLAAPDNEDFENIKKLVKKIMRKAIGLRLNKFSENLRRIKKHHDENTAIDHLSDYDYYTKVYPSEEEKLDPNSRWNSTHFDSQITRNSFQLWTKENIKKQEEKDVVEIYFDDEEKELNQEFKLIEEKIDQHKINLLNDMQALEEKFKLEAKAILDKYNNTKNSKNGYIEKYKAVKKVLKRPREDEEEQIEKKDLTKGLYFFKTKKESNLKEIKKRKKIDLKSEDISSLEGTFKFFNQLKKTNVPTIKSSQIENNNPSPSNGRPSTK